MYISKIIEFSKDGCEADVYVSDGTFTIMCYAYPVDSVCLGQDVTAVFSYYTRVILFDIKYII